MRMPIAFQITVAKIITENDDDIRSIICDSRSDLPEQEMRQQYDCTCDSAKQHAGSTSSILGRSLIVGQQVTATATASAPDAWELSGSSSPCRPGVDEDCCYSHRFLPAADSNR